MADTFWTTTTTPDSDLKGSMIMDGDTVTSYTSTNLGLTDNNPKMADGSGLNFKVEFIVTNGKSTPPTKKKYRINAQKDGAKKFVGTAGPDSPGAGQEDWTATDNGPEPKAY